MAYVDREIQVGVGGVVWRQGAVLLVQMGYGGANGRWIIPGGYLEPGEVSDVAAQREVNEETGVHARVERLVAVRARATADRLKTDVYLVFDMSYTSGEALADGVEVTDARFWPLEEALASPEVVPFTKECIKAALEPGGLLPNAFVTSAPNGGWAFFTAAGATSAGPQSPGS